MKEASPKLTQGPQTENAALTTNGDEVLEGEIISEKTERRTHVDFATKYPGFGQMVLELGDLLAQKKEGFANGKLAYIASLLAAATQKKIQISIRPEEELSKTLPTHLLEAEDVYTVLEVVAKEGKALEAIYLLETVLDVLKNTRSEKDALLFVAQLRTIAEKNAPKDTAPSNTRALEKTASRVPAGKEPGDEKASAEAILSILDSLKNPLGQVVGGLQNKENRKTPETFEQNALAIQYWFLKTKGRDGLWGEYGFDFEFDDARWNAFNTGLLAAKSEQALLDLLKEHLVGDVTPADVLAQLALSDSKNKYLKGLATKAGGKKPLDEMLDEGLDDENDTATETDEVLDLSGGSTPANGFNLNVDTTTPTLNVETNTGFTGGEQMLGNPEELFGLKSEGTEFDLEGEDLGSKTERNRFERKTPEQTIKTIFNELINIKDQDPSDMSEEDLEDLFNKLSDWRYQATFYYEKLLAESQNTPPTISAEEIQRIEKLVQTIQARISRILEKFPKEYQQEQLRSQTTSSFINNIDAFVQANGLEKEWATLSEGQRAIALRVFDQNALMYVESLSRNLHDEQLQELESSMWGVRHVKKLWAGINRNKQVGKIAQQQLKSFVSDNASEVKKQMFESALLGAPTDLSVDITRNGSPAINFTSELQKNFNQKEGAMLALNLTAEEERLLANFNAAATNFALIPEDYGSSTADDRNWLTKKTNMRVFNKEFFGGFDKTEKRIYDKARIEFEVKRDRVAEILIAKGIEKELIEATYFSLNNTVEAMQASQAMADFDVAFKELSQKGKMRKGGLLNDKADFAKGMGANIAISGGSKLLTKGVFGLFGVATTPVTLTGIVLSMGFAGARGAMTGEGRAQEGLREQDIQAKYSNEVKKIALAELKLNKYESLITEEGQLTDQEKASAIKSKKDGESEDEAIARRLEFIQDQISSLRNTVDPDGFFERNTSAKTSVWNKVKAYTIGGDLEIKKESLKKEGMIEAAKWSEIFNGNLKMLDKDSDALLKFKTANETLLDEANTTPEAAEAKQKFAELTLRHKTRLAKVFQQVEYVEEALAESRVAFGKEVTLAEGRTILSLNEEGELEGNKTLTYKTSALNNKMALKNMLRRAKTELFTEGVLAVNESGEREDEISESFKEVERNADLITSLVSEKAFTNDRQRTKYQKEQVKAAAIRGAFWALAIGAEEAQFGIMRDAVAEAREAVGIFGYDKEHLLHEIATKAHEVAIGKGGEIPGLDKHNGSISYEDFLAIAKTYTGHDVQISREVFESKAVKDVISAGDAGFGTDRINLSADEKKAFIIGKAEEVADTTTRAADTTTHTTKDTGTVTPKNTQTTQPSNTNPTNPTAQPTTPPVTTQQNPPLNTDSIQKLALARDAQKTQEALKARAVADSIRKANAQTVGTVTNPQTKIDTPATATTKPAGAEQGETMLERVAREWKERVLGGAQQKPATTAPAPTATQSTIPTKPAEVPQVGQKTPAGTITDVSKPDAKGNVVVTAKDTLTGKTTKTEIPAVQNAPVAPIAPATAANLPKPGTQTPTGTVKAATVEADKSVKVITTDATGKETVTTTSADGKTVTQVNPDKTKVIETKNPDGSVHRQTEDPSGKVLKKEDVPAPKSAKEIEKEITEKATAKEAEKNRLAAEQKRITDSTAVANKKLPPSNTPTNPTPATEPEAASGAKSYTKEDLPKGALITSKAGHNGISYALWEQMKHNEAASNAIAQEHYGKDFSELSHKQQVSAMYKHLIQQGYIKVDDNGKMVEDVRVRPSGKVAYVLGEDGNIVEYKLDENGEQFIHEEHREGSLSEGYRFEGEIRDDGKDRLEDYEYTGKGRAPRAATGSVVGTGSGRGPRVGGNTAPKTNPADLLNNTQTLQTTVTNPAVTAPIVPNPAVVNNVPPVANQAPVFGAAPDTKPGVMQAALTSTHLEAGRFVAYKSDFKGHSPSFTREGSITIKVPTADGGFKVGNIGYWQQVIANNAADIRNPNITEVPVHFGPLTLNGDGGFNNPEALLQRPEVRAAIERGDIGTTIDLTKTEALTGGVSVNGNTGRSTGVSGNLRPQALGGGGSINNYREIHIGHGLGNSFGPQAQSWDKLFEQKDVAQVWGGGLFGKGVKDELVGTVYPMNQKYLGYFLNNAPLNLATNQSVYDHFKTVVPNLPECKDATPGDFANRIIPGTNVVAYINPEDDKTGLLDSKGHNVYIPKAIAEAAFRNGRGDRERIALWLQMLKTAQAAGMQPGQGEHIEHFTNACLDKIENELKNK